MGKKPYVEFYGTPVTEPSRSSIKRRLNQFLRNEFDAFRDRAEMEALCEQRINYALKTFGDDSQYYDIRADIDEDGSVEFEIYDEKRDDIIVFYAARLTGELIEVHVLADDIIYVHNVLKLLNKPSWIH